MDKMDFKLALEDYKNASDSWCHAELFCNHGDTIQTALRIAERLQSGEVSNEMCDAYIDSHSQRIGKCGDNVIGDDFKAMIQQLIKECGDE